MSYSMINEEAIKQVVTEIVNKYQMAGRISCEAGSNAGASQLFGNDAKVCCKSQDNVEILVEASGRHVHLSEADIEKLFGKGYKLTPKKNLSQPGQFASEERVTLIGPKNIYKNVAVLGPARKETQVELSISDAKFLGVDAPVNMSGNLVGAGDIIIATDKEAISAKGSCIVAQNHIHITPSQAEQWGFYDGQIVSVSMKTARPVTFDGVVMRVSSQAGLAMHIDFDEANACAFKTGDKGVINCTDSKVRLACSDAASSSETPCVGIKKKFITEEDIKKALKNGGNNISVPKGAILSAPAKDLVNSKKITVKFI